MEIVFNSGAMMATIGSIAVKQPELFHNWLQRYGGGKLLLGADVKEDEIVVSGWTERTGIPVLDFIRQHTDAGVQQLFCTDVSKDGLLQGPALDLYKKILDHFPGLHLIASGGVAGIADIALLEEAGLSGVIVGKAIYEGKISLQELRRFEA
jgi:phosphoribosylformimino-5-aminoimidazole carboxamide ribotide isomerase